MESLYVSPVNTEPCPPVSPAQSPCAESWVSRSGSAGEVSEGWAGIGNVSSHVGLEYLFPFRQSESRAVFRSVIRRVANHAPVRLLAVSVVPAFSLLVAGTVLAGLAGLALVVGEC